MKQIRAWDGKQPLRLVEPPFVPQAKEGAEFTRDDEARLVRDFLELIQLLMTRGNEQARGALYETSISYSITSLIDVILHELHRQSWWQAEKMRSHARWFVSEARHREPLRFGISMLGLSGTDQDLETLRTLARHDDFTIACANAVSGFMPDPIDEWWHMAKSANGWGKVHLVKRLARRCASREDIQEWLVRYGCRNFVSADYVAYSCASAGKLGHALAQREIDDELFESAGILIRSMISAGPAENLEDYEDGVRAIAAWLEHVDQRGVHGKTREIIEAIGNWINQDLEPLVWDRRAEQLGWTPDVREQIAARCESLLERHS